LVQLWVTSFMNEFKPSINVKCHSNNTWHSKTVRESATWTFYSFLNSDFKAFLMIYIMFERARLGFKRHLLSISFQCSMPRSLKISYWSRKMSHGEGRGSENCLFFARKAWFCIKLKTPIDGITRKKQFNGEKLVVKVI